MEFPDETLQFIKSHPLMDAAVPSIGDEPWFTKTRVRYADLPPLISTEHRSQAPWVEIYIRIFPFIRRYRLTALAVDSTAGPNKNYTVVFIGSEAGIVLKVLAKSSPFSLNDSVLLEEIDVFNRAKYVGCFIMPLISFVWSCS